eukprot:4899463-Prymnesium_polylepis.1
MASAAAATGMPSSKSHTSAVRWWSARLWPSAPASSSARMWCGSGSSKPLIRPRCSAFLRRESVGCASP